MVTKNKLNSCGTIERKTYFSPGYFYFQEKQIPAIKANVSDVVSLIFCSLITSSRNYEELLLKLMFK